MLQPVKDFGSYQIQAQLKYEEYDDLRELTTQEREELALSSFSFALFLDYIYTTKQVDYMALMAESHATPPLENATCVFFVTCPSCTLWRFTIS